MRRAAFLVFAVLPLISGCKIFMGFVAMQGGAKEPIIGREQTIEHCGQWLKRSQPLVYCGSDSQWHYFYSRPIDDNAHYQIARRESVIKDERPFSGKYQPGYYSVDFRNGFDKRDTIPVQNRQGL